MKVVAIIQARMGSTRLPGKVMMDLAGHRVLEWVVRACEAAPGVDSVWVATSDLPADDVIFNWCEDMSINCARGSETDVLDRMHACATIAEAGVSIRITGDCPFVDPEVIGHVVRMMRDNADCLYCSNTSPRTYPDGLDIQAMRYRALDAAFCEATRPIDRDCVTTFIERNRSRFPAEAVINPLGNRASERWVLDTAADYEFCKAIATIWGWDNGPPSQLDILNILDVRPDLRAHNRDGIMNERYFDALAEEPIYERKYTRSQEAFQRAKAVIPLAAQTFSKSHLQYPQPSPLFLSHGDGCLAWDVDGNEYVDLVSALLPNVLGYRDPDVDGAVRRQLSAGTSFSLATELEAELAETLCRLIPCAEAVRFGKTGTDVTSAAIRVARAFTGRERVLVAGGYHGWQDWSTQRDLGVPEAVKALTKRIPFGDKVAADRAIDQRVNVGMGALAMSWDEIAKIEDQAKKGWIAAIIVEPEGDPGYLEHLRWLCTRYGPLLIFDEVITGFRVDLGGAQKFWNVIPDLATFGKSMANGMPISALVGRKDIMAKFEPPDNVFYSGTFFGETLSIAAAIATIKKLERESVIPKLWEKGARLADEADNLIYKHKLTDFIQISGLGPFKRLKFRDDKIAALFRREMVASGTLIVASHNVSHSLGEPEIKRVLKSYDHALGVVAGARLLNDLDSMLGGATVTPTVRQQ